MGKKKVLRVVLDTNVVVSCLLFSGDLSRIYKSWKTRRFIPCLSRETFGELLKVLSYPKFSLDKEEIEYLIYQEVLPYFEVVEAKESVRGLCADKDDDKFVSLALSARADYIVTGDRKLLEIGKYRKVKIITPKEFMKAIGKRQ